jgi:polyribonucleotide nucleotidyltransferase
LKLGTDPAGIEAVLAKIKSITFKPQMGETYEVKVLDFGAVVRAAPGVLHVSRISMGTLKTFLML